MFHPYLLSRNHRLFSPVRAPYNNSSSLARIYTFVRIGTYILRYNFFEASLLLSHAHIKVKSLLFTAAGARVVYNIHANIFSVSKSLTRGPRAKTRIRKE